MKWTAEMSLEGICNWVYASVEILELIKRMDLEAVKLNKRWEDGYKMHQ